MSYVPMPVFADGGRGFVSGWARLIDWMETHFPALLADLNDPASEADIDSAQVACGVVFPDDLRALYRAADGERGNIGLFFGLPLLPLERVVHEWRAWQDVIAQCPELNDNEAGFHRSTPPGAIAELYANPGWIPFAHDHGGNHLGADLAPGPNGRIGQVINFGRDEDDKFVIAPSLASFLHWYADNVEVKNYRIAKLPDDQGIDFVIADPANEHFLDAVRNMGQS